MVNPISGVDPLLAAGLSAAAPVAAGPLAAAGGKDFNQLLMESLDEVNRLQAEADDRVAALARGDWENVAEVFTAVNKAGIAFDMLMQIRNKLLDAYQEVMQMRI